MTTVINGTSTSASAPAVVGDDGDTGIFYPAANQVAIATGGAQRVLVDSSGLVSISGTGTEVLALSKSGGNNAYLQPVSSSDAGLQVKDSAGSINLTVGTSSKTLALQGGVVSSGTGITFPASQNASSDANTLDDYEEGTWTPTLTFGGSTTGITYATQNGTYTKVGRLVSIRAVILLTNKGSASGTAAITGVPFTPADGTTSGRNTGSIYMGNGTGLANLFLQLLVLSDGSNRIDLNWFNGTADGNVANTNCTNNTYVAIQFNYFTT